MNDVTKENQDCGYHVSLPNTIVQSRIAKDLQLSFNTLINTDESTIIDRSSIATHTNYTTNTTYRASKLDVGVGKASFGDVLILGDHDQDHGGHDTINASLTLEPIAISHSPASLRYSTQSPNINNISPNVIPIKGNTNSNTNSNSNKTTSKENRSSNKQLRTSALDTGTRQTSHTLTYTTTSIEVSRSEIHIHNNANLAAPVDALTMKVCDKIILAFRRIYHKYIDSNRATFLIDISRKNKEMMRTLYDYNYYYANFEDESEKKSDKMIKLNQDSLINKEYKDYISEYHKSNGMRSLLSKHDLYKWLLIKCLSSMEKSLDQITLLMDDSYIRFQDKNPRLCQELCNIVRNTQVTVL